MLGKRTGSAATAAAALSRDRVVILFGRILRFYADCEMIMIMTMMMIMMMMKVFKQQTQWKTTYYIFIVRFSSHAVSDVKHPRGAP